MYFECCVVNMGAAVFGIILQCCWSTDRFNRKAIRLIDTNRFAVPVSTLKKLPVLFRTIELSIELPHGLKHLSERFVGLLAVNPVSDFVSANLTGPDIAISSTQSRSTIENFEKSFFVGEGGRGCRWTDFSSGLL